MKLKLLGLLVLLTGFTAFAQQVTNNFGVVQVVSLSSASSLFSAPTNAVTLAYINFTNGVSTFQTNATFTFLGFLNLNPTNYEKVVTYVTNSGASSINISFPLGLCTNGAATWLVNAGGVTRIDWEHYGYWITNAIAYPIH
jgi:hypothetical protein